MENINVLLVLASRAPMHKSLLTSPQMRVFCYITLRRSFNLRLLSARSVAGYQSDGVTSAILPCRKHISSKADNFSILTVHLVKIPNLALRFLFKMVEVF